MPQQIINIKDVIDATMSGIAELDEWCEEIYQSNFAPYFTKVRDLYTKLKRSEDIPISDDDLSKILIDIPLDLFSASEAVHKLKTHQEIMKLNTKYNKLVDDGNDADKAYAQTMEAVTKAFENIINRAEKEISYCRELIMGAKKIWDARRHIEAVMPVAENSEEKDSPKKLPEYIK